ncbi:MAG: peptidoglycan editing factor PgeF [Rhodobacterales bacterium]|nr:peptidoglycan editing factor PgeF [Rhodobacterales bacterium]
MAPMITAQALARLPGLRHGFLTRRGGVSGAPYDSLNRGLGSDDDPAAVGENRSRALARIGADGADLVTVSQVHSPNVVVVDDAWAPGEAPRADAMVTRRPGLALGILTADCAPVLLADAQAGVVGAAHAGWNGAVSGVLEAAVGAMEALGADRAAIHAAVGPCIHQPSYEVGPEFRDRFVAEDAANDRFFVPSDRPGHHRFDLPGYVAARLSALGLGAVEGSPADTCADAGRFFSYRRTTLNGGGDYGRLISIIQWAGDDT